MGGVGLGEGVIGEKWRELKEREGFPYVGEAGRRGLCGWLMWAR